MVVCSLTSFHLQLMIGTMARLRLSQWLTILPQSSVV
ncbi:hypothetical protein C7445_11645 [Alicyclobacillus sacchari]|uniref:Uncharacterized protein n=1 Tax=Alicyclobacillus sacchari TaxID=392010 RepID=A0A4R8LGV8_9BACL|nr:hypothetical protein C7445_11645 [Alicyclobacillus sacchari]